MKVKKKPVRRLQRNGRYLPADRKKNLGEWTSLRVDWEVREAIGARAQNLGTINDTLRWLLGLPEDPSRRHGPKAREEVLA